MTNKAKKLADEYVSVGLQQDLRVVLERTGNDKRAMKAVTLHVAETVYCLLTIIM